MYDSSEEGRAKMEVNQHRLDPDQPATAAAGCHSPRVKLLYLVPLDLMYILLGNGKVSRLVGHFMC